MRAARTALEAARSVANDSRVSAPTRTLAEALVGYFEEELGIVPAGTVLKRCTDADGNPVVFEADGEGGKRVRS